VTHPGPSATYHCTVCGASWSYEAVRHLACCRDCGSGLLRDLGDDAVVAPRQRPSETPRMPRLRYLFGLGDRAA
jgi:hypothetical protein